MHIYITTSRFTSAHKYTLIKMLTFILVLTFKVSGCHAKPMSTTIMFNFSKKINPKEKEKQGVPLVVTYYPSLNCLSKIIRDNLYLLYMNDEVKKVFSPKPMISFRSARKLSSYLVRAKLYPIDRVLKSVIILIVTINT